MTTPEYRAKRAEYQRQWRQRNIVRVKEQAKMYRAVHKEKIHQYMKTWAAQNKDLRKEKARQYYATNKHRWEDGYAARLRRKKRDPASVAWVSYKAIDKKKKRTFSISKEEWKRIIEGPCVYCGKNGPGGADRIDNTKGHISGNCVSCCGPHNLMKGQQSKEQFLANCISVVRHLAPELMK
jgi:hypothetical protein